MLFWAAPYYAQNGTTPPNLIPPSPEASSLFKFTETPVNLNSGLVSIGVPIYTIKTKGVEIPISLGYHSRGVQVGELASRVGLGWTLSYGGMVSRQVRGKSDEGESGGYLKNTFYDDFFTNPDTRSSVNQAYANNAIDLDPDLFFFNIPGHSGKFIFDQVTKQPWQQEFKDIEITPIRTSATGIIKGFKIVDAQGNTYYFGALSSSTSTTSIIGNKENAPGYWIKNNGVSDSMETGVVSDGFSGWHLIKIITYFNEEINFSYQPEYPQYIRKSYDENLDEPGSADAISYYSKVNSTQYQISEINYPGGKVLFNRSTGQRQDLPGGYALDHIIIQNSLNQEIKRFDFGYVIETSATNSNYIPQLASEDPSSHKRMFLKSVTESSLGLSNPAYEFEYSSVKLPNRFSTSQDNWGYFNGANNGPFMPFLNYGTYSMDRRVDATKNGAGLLTKVIYPTGGFSSYEYEQNIGVKPPFLDQTVSPGNNPEVYKSVLLGHLMNDKFNSGVYSIPVVIGENKSSMVSSSVDFDYYDPMDGPCQPFESTAECRFSMILDGGPGNTYVLPYGANMSLSGVPSGNYTLKVYPPNGDSSIYFTTRIEWYEEEPLEDSNGQPLMLASGKRIKKITYSDGLSPVKYKEFEYQNPDGSNSGYIFGYPNFYAIKDTYEDYNITWKYGSKPGSPLTSLQGNDLSYGHVIEYEGTKTNNIGKTEHRFTNFPDQGTYYEFPYHPPIDNQWLRGKPLETKVFKKNGSSYSLIKEIKNEYFDGENEASSGFIAYEPIDGDLLTAFKDEDYFRMPLAIFIPDDGQQSNGPDFKTYYQQGGTVDLFSTKTTDYLSDESGMKQVVTTTRYKYNHAKHYQVDEIEETIDNKLNQTLYSYPSEVDVKTDLGYDDLSTAELSGINYLKSKNRVMPVQEESQVKSGSTILSKAVKRTNFKVDPTSTVALPFSIASSKLNDPLQPRVTFHKYDVTGKPLEVSQQNGPLTVYIWGYHRQYPVAKVENTTYAAIEALTGFGSNFNLGSGGLNQTQENALRSLPNALVTTYTYKPLVGMLSQTDPNGHTITYQYDHLGRLETVRNQDGKIVKHINYYFKDN